MQKTHAPNKATDQRLLLRSGDRGSIRNGGHLAIAHLPEIKGKKTSESGSSDTTRAGGSRHAGGAHSPRCLVQPTRWTPAAVSGPTWPGPGLI